MSVLFTGISLTKAKALCVVFTPKLVESRTIPHTEQPFSVCRWVNAAAAADSDGDGGDSDSDGDFDGMMVMRIVML